MNERRIVCAAQRHADGRVMLSVRHMDHGFWRTLLELPAGDVLPRGGQVPVAVVEWRDCEQGFVDNRGEFLTREDAWPVALEAGQILPAELQWCRGQLHSEHLY